MNALATKYCCTKCDDYPVLVLTVNFSDSKSAFQNDFITKYGVTTICVPKEDGGSDFNTVLPNQNSSGSSYGGTFFFIKPDKTFIGDAGASPIVVASEQDIIDAGIQPHTCNTSIAQKLNSIKVNNNLIFQKLYKSGFTVKVLKDDVYSISFYSANGKLRTTILKKLSAGSHQISFEKGKLANGVYFVEMRNGQNITREKVVLE